MSENRKDSEKELVQRTSSGVQKGYLAGQENTCKTDHGSCCCFRNPRSVDRGDRRNPEIRY